MKATGKPWGISLLAVFALTGFAASARAGATPLFELDTRGADGLFSNLFTLDTRDPDVGTASSLFALDTRGDLSSGSSLFTLDTRGREESYAPQNLLLVPEQLTVARLTWDYFGMPLGFRIQRRDPLGDWEALLAGGAERSWADTSVQAGRFYEYRVAAVLPTGVSDYSEIAYIQMPAIPHAPHALGTALTDDGHVALSWQDRSKDEDGFEIWRKEGPEGGWSPLFRERADATSCLDRGVAPSTLYAYKLRAFNRWGNSGFSKESSVATPASETGCGYELRLEEGVFRLDGVAMDRVGMNQAGCRALLQGEVLAFIRSPKGDSPPVRVVLGFRDAEGLAAGTPVDLADFCCVPGCPGVPIKASVPESFRAPEAGVYTLWLELAVATRDPVEAFMAERHAQESPMRKRLFDVGVRSNELAETRVCLIGGKATPGNVVDVPVQLISGGGERSIAFSVAHGEGLRWLGADLGADAPQAWLRIGGNLPDAAGVTMKAPLESPFGAGSKHLLTLRFMAERAGEHILRFQDVPVGRMVMDRSAHGGDARWEDGLVTVAAAGWEGDVSPRSRGDGVVDGQDARLAWQFALGLLGLPTDPDEFRRLDCAPAEVCGDGIVDLADVVAIQHVADGQAEPQAACGPVIPMERSSPAAGSARGSLMRRLSIGAPEEVRRGDTFWASIDLAAQGDEHGLSLSLSFDAEVLAYRDLRLVGAATNGVFLPNLEAAAQGSIALGITLAGTETFAAGHQPVAEILFAAQEGRGTEVAALGYAGAPAECRMVGLTADALESAACGSDVIVSESISSSAPLPPEAGQAVALDTNQIKVSWATVPWATGYRIRRRLEGETTWTRLADFEGERTVFVDDGLPPGTVCSYLVTALNPQGEESSAIRLQAKTWTAMERWRHAWFGQIGDSGLASDREDPDGDSLPNLIECQLGTNPWAPDGQPFRHGVEEVFAGKEEVTISYVLSAGAPGRVSFEFTEDLLVPVSWRSDGLAPVSRQRTGKDDRIKVRLPDGAATNRMLFLRMRAE